jgi:hypothetical protein
VCGQPTGHVTRLLDQELQLAVGSRRVADGKRVVAVRPTLPRLDSGELAGPNTSPARAPHKVWKNGFNTFPEKERQRHQGKTDHAQTASPLIQP